MRQIKVVVLLVRQLQHGFTKNAKVSPNLTVVLIGRPRITRVDGEIRTPPRRGNYERQEVSSNMVTMVGTR